MVQSLVQESQGVTVGRVTFDRADKKNALTPRMLEAFVDAIDRHAVNPAIRAVLIEGNGAAFCAGFDLSLCADNSDALAVLLKDLARAVKSLRTCSVPVIAAAHGAAIAGGCALLGGADIVVSHTDAKIGYPVVRLGISPAVSAPFFARSVGFARARERMLDSALISGWEAARIGLVHECLEDAGKVRDRALAIARELASKPSVGIRATKQLMNNLEREAVDAWGERALEISLDLVGSHEERTRLEALWKK
jgi:enoyl-CoA hydratase/carnithine racemase